MEVTSKITQVLDETVQKPFVEFKKKHHVLAGFVTIFVALMIAIIALVSGKTKSAHADATTQMEIAAPVIATAGDLEEGHDHSEEIATPQSFEVPVMNNDGLPLTASSHIPAEPLGVSKRPEVHLTKKMATLMNSVSKFMSRNNRYAIVTSGVRSGESQLELIKQRVEEKGGEKLHAGIFTATLKDSTVWSKAWRWLANKRVPINPPADIVQNGRVVKKSSAHLKGQAIDLISPNLRDLYSMLTRYAASKEAKQSPVKIRGIVLEPYCVHIVVG